MCIKNIYHVVYVDGEREVTERLDPCRSGQICTDPIVREFDRTVKCTRLRLSSNSLGRIGSPSSSLRDRQPTPYRLDSRSTSRSRDAHKEEQGERRSAHRVLYIDDDRRDDLGSRRRASYHHTEPIPIPKPHWSWTMPVVDGSYGEAKRESSRSLRPIIVESSDRGSRSSLHRESSSAVPLGPYQLLYNYGSGRSRRDRERQASEIYLCPLRSFGRHSRSSSEGPSAAKEGDYEDGDSRHYQSKLISVDGHDRPGISVDAVYGSSPLGGSDRSSWSSRPSDDRWVHHQTADTQTTKLDYGGGASVTKGVRWEDQVRAAQNANISSRPKLSRSATLTGVGTGPRLHGKVKGILKRTHTDSSTRPPTGEYGSCPGPEALGRVDPELFDYLYDPVGGSVDVDDRRTAAQRQARRETRELGQRELCRERPVSRSKPRDGRRLMNEMPPRRFAVQTTVCSRRSEALYPGEGRYKYTSGYC